MIRFKMGQGGFTLIEMMVVMAVLAVLSGIVVGGVSGVGTKSKETTIKSDQQVLQSAVDRFYSDSDPQRYPIAATTATGTPGVTPEGYYATPAGALPDHTTSNPVPTSGAVPIDFTFPVFKASAATSDTFVPKYLKGVPSSVDRVTWWVKFPEAQVFWTGDPTAATTAGAHPNTLK